MTIKILDTFAGIGGFSYAAEKLVGGFKTTQFIEINPYCQKVLKKHFPNVPCHDDIKTFTAFPGQYDVICGGFPCQDISVAGRKEGITKQSRSGLFYELIRVIRLVRPKFVVMENVAAILNNGLDIVLGELSEAGYDAEWAVISASSLGACHRRSRWWLVAYPNSNGHQRGCTETRNKIASGQDTSGKWSTNTSELERQSNDGRNKAESRTDENLSGSSDGGKTIFTTTRKICNLHKKTNNDQGTGDQNNYQKNNDRTLVSQRQRRLQLSKHRGLENDKTIFKGDSIRQGDDNGENKRMDNQKSNVTNSNSIRTQGKDERYNPSREMSVSNGKTRRTLSPNWREYVSEPVLCRGNDGLRGRVDRLKALGNSVVPQCAAIPLQRIKDLEKNNEL